MRRVAARGLSSALAGKGLQKLVSTAGPSSYGHGMARTRKPSKKPSPAASATPITLERAARLFRLLTLLGQKPQTRSVLTGRLRLNLRGFYRDLEVLRTVGVTVDLVEGRYVLHGTADDAQTRLPFPDPGLTLGEAEQLAKGRSATHRKLKKQIAAITG